MKYVVKYTVKLYYENFEIKQTFMSVYIVLFPLQNISEIVIFIFVWNWKMKFNRRFFIQLLTSVWWIVIES